MSILERVAQAIKESCPLEGMHNQVAQHMARAAVSAMREPTEAMNNKGCSHMPPGVECFPSDVEHVYAVMIDAALAGEIAK